jgi:hypothetical protein
MVNKLLTNMEKFTVPATAPPQSGKQGTTNDTSLLELASWFWLEQHRNFRLSPGGPGRTVGFFHDHGVNRTPAAMRAFSRS